MIGVMLTPIEPLVKEALENSGCLKWLASNSKDLTPVTSFITQLPVVEVYKTKSPESFQVNSDSWKEDLATALSEIYAELPKFKFSAIVHDSSSEDFFIVTRIDKRNKTLFRQAKVKYVKSFQDPDVFLSEIL